MCPKSYLYPETVVQHIRWVYLLATRLSIRIEDTQLTKIAKFHD